MRSESIPAQSQAKKVNDITLMTLAEVASMIKAGKISPVEVVEACLKRTEALQGKLNAYVYLMADEAKKAAKRAESAVRKNYKGPLHGIPIALKDLYYTKGIPTTGGSGLMVDFRPEFNGTIVQRLIDAGAIIMGKTNTHEWAFGPTTEESFFGPSRNPWNPKKITGGSSGGSAIAAATGMAYVAMGSDTGGSIRIPSALCGTVGFKPTYGLASLNGIIGLSFTLDTPGPLARSVMDAALAMDAYAGPDPLDPCPGSLSGPIPKYAASLKKVDNLKGKVIAVPTNFFFDKTDYEVEKLVMKGVAAMKDLGAEVRRIEIPSLELVPNVSTVILFSEAAQYHKDRFAKYPDKYQPGVRARLEQGGAYKAVEYIDALKGREKIMADWERALTGIDGVVVPTCPIPAYDIGLPAPWHIQTRGKTEEGRAMCTYHTRLANTAGIPAISLPCGLTSEGLPVGLMIMGRRGDDAGVLRLGYAYEKPGENAPTPVEIVIEGDATAPPATRDPTAAATVIGRASLERPGASAAEVLADAPGVQVQRTGSSSNLATASLRGATAAQTPVYLGGVRLNDEVSGTADLSTVPLFMLHHVEVYRGNAPVAADRLGLGGAIFFEPRLPQGPELRLGQLLGSHGAAGTWVAAGIGDPRGGALVALRRDAARNDYPYVNDAGTRFEPDDDRRVERANADHATWDLWALGRFGLGPRGHATLLHNAFVREQGVTGLSVIPAARSRARVERQLFAVSTDVPCAEARDDGRERCRVELVTTGLASRTTLDNPARELSLGATSVTTEGRRVSELVRWRRSLGPGATLTASGEQSFESLALRRASVGDLPFALAARRSVGRPSLDLALMPSRALEGIALVAVEHHTTEGPPGTGNDGAPTRRALEPAGRVGLCLHALESLDLIANAGRAARVPTLGELYGVAPLVRGNPALEPEVGNTVDLGLRAHGASRGGALGGTLEAIAFRRQVADLVVYRQSLRQLVPFNLGAARILGLELAGELRWRRALRAGINATLQDPRDVSPDRALANDLLPLRSRLVTTPYVEWTRQPALRWLDRVTLGARALHRSSRYQDPAGLVIIPHQTTVDLDAAATLLDERLALRAAIANALDALEWDLVGLPLPGRTVSASVEVVLP